MIEFIDIFEGVVYGFCYSNSTHNGWIEIVYGDKNELLAIGLNL